MAKLINPPVAVREPVKLAVEDIVCPFTSPEVIVPIFTRFLEESTIWVPFKSIEERKLPVAA